jgi:hypothetical protein
MLTNYCITGKMKVNLIRKNNVDIFFIPFLNEVIFQVSKSRMLFNF